MTDQPSFEARLADAYARLVAAVPVEVDSRAVAAAVAATGSRRRSWLEAITPARRIGLLVGVALLALVLSATALLVGSRLARHPSAGGLLVYESNGDIYLADQDGAHPRTVADGVPYAQQASADASYLLGDGGPTWAPDGRHFLFFGTQGSSQRLTGYIADDTGRVLASIPDIWVDATWSPDSTRIEAWTGGTAWIGTTHISIFGVDGAVQQTLSLPPGFVRAREHPGRWAADGRSVYVTLGQGDGPVGVWQLPLDGSTPRRIAPESLITGGLDAVRYSPDGSRMIKGGAGFLVVANADGTDARGIGPSGVSNSVWAPTGTRVAYIAGPPSGPYEIHVVDLVSGEDTTIATDLQVNGRGLLGWSPSGDRVLFASLDQAGTSSLWSVRADGTDRKVLVAGADGGEWQPGQDP